MNLSALEQALLPIACPLLQSLWSNQLLPAISAAAKSSSPEIQIVESQVVAMLDAVVKAELAKLQSV
jgi:hypothetical protein